MKVLGAAFVAVAILAAGCKKGGYDAGQMAALTEPERKIVGKYNLEFSVAQADETEEMKKAIEMLDTFRAPVSMECLPDKTFSMMTMETPITGTWALDGTMVRLRIEKIGDKRPDEIGKIAAKNQGVKGWDMNPTDRTEFLEAAKYNVVFDRAMDLTVLQVGVDGKSLYAAKQNSQSMFGTGINVFRQVKD